MLYPVSITLLYYANCPIGGGIHYKVHDVGADRRTVKTGDCSIPQPENVIPPHDLHQPQINTSRAINRMPSLVVIKFFVVFFSLMQYLNVKFLFSLK